MALAKPSKRTVEELIADWPEKTTGQQQHPKETAEKMLDRYGPPDEATPQRLIWHNNGPWKRTEVHRDGPKHDFPIPHIDHLYQYIDYQVPPEKHDELAQYDGSTHAHRTEGELVAACHKEEANILALNLAHDIITDKTTVEQAREDYAKINAKLMAGGTPEATQRFQFPLPEGDQRDPDVTIATEKITQNSRLLGLVGIVLVGILYYALRRKRSRQA